MLTLDSLQLGDFLFTLVTFIVLAAFLVGIGLLVTFLIKRNKRQ